MALSTLCPRQRQVVAALIAGDDTRAITERLVISRPTVRNTRLRWRTRVTTS